MREPFSISDTRAPLGERRRTQDGLVILHLMTTFPPLSETFVMREIRQLRAHGWNVVIGALRPLHKSPAAQGFEDLEPFVSPATWVSLDLLIGSLFFLVCRPRETWQCLTLMFKGLKDRKHFVRMVYVFLSAMRIAFQHRKSRVGLVRADFIHSEALAARFAGALLHVPFSLTVYTVFREYPEDVVKGIVHRAAFLVADTAQVSHYLANMGADQNRIHVVRNSVNLDEFPRRLAQRASGPPIVLGVARLDPKKGFDVLISACSILRERGVHFRCVIVGDGEERERLLIMRARLKLEDHVEMTGELSFAEVKPWYYRASVFAMPSVVTSEGQTDGLPTVVIEAMASGLPIVGSLVAGIPEAVQEGINGFLVPANEPEQLANRLQILLEQESLCWRFGGESRRMAEAQFSLDKKAEMLSQLICGNLKFVFRSSVVQV